MAGTIRVNQKLKPRGSNHVGMRQFNERVVLQAIRLSGSMPKAEIARTTHLTAQTVQQIIARLELDDLVIKLKPVRGRVGQPSVPMALNPDGAFSLGLTIGRRNAELLLVDFCGHVRNSLTLEYDFPDPSKLFDDIEALYAQMLEGMGQAKAQRLCGIGVAAPLSLGGWKDLLGVDPELTQRWSLIDIRQRIAEISGLPVEFVKDTAAASVAELVAGRGHAERSFLYLYVDTFIGGGVVLDSRLYAGVHGNAGAVGSLSTAVADASQTRTPPQLLSRASLYRLQNLYREHGLAVDAWRDARALCEPWLALSQDWLRDAAPAIALAIHASACLLDLDSVIIDGSFSRELLGALLDNVRATLAAYDWQGVQQPSIGAGTIGPDARALGGALLPLYAHFTPNHELFLKSAILA